MAKDNISIASLFGISPEEYQYQRAQNDLDTITTAAPNNGVNQLLMLGGRQLGRGLGDLMGAQDPTLARLTKIQAVGKMVQDSGVDPSNPDEVYPAMIKGFQQAGLMQEAMMAAQQFQALQMKRQELVYDGLKSQASLYKAMGEKTTAKNNSPDALSKEDVDAALTLGLPVKEAKSQYSLQEWNMIQEHKKAPKRNALDADWQDAAQYLGLPVRQFKDQYTQEQSQAIIDFINQEKRKNAKAGKTEIINNNNFNPDAEKKFAEKAGSEIGESTANIQNNLDALTAVRDALSDLNKGIYSGAYANIEKGIAKYSGGKIGSLDKVARTELFKSALGEVVLPRMKDLGGNDTKEEREYIERMLGGSIEFEEAAIRQILKRAEAKIERRIQRIQNQAKSVSPNWQPPTEGVTNSEKVRPMKRFKVTKNPDGSFSKE